MKRLTSTEFETAVSDWLTAFREDDIFTLSESQLMSTPLIGDLLMPGEEISLANCTEFSKAILLWGIDQLKPTGEQDWFANRWRTYNILHGYFVDQLTMAVLAEKLGIADQTVYDWRASALLNCAKLFYRECYQPKQLNGRLSYVVAQKLSLLDAPEKRLLALVTVAQEPLSKTQIFSSEESHSLKKFEELFLLEGGAGGNTIDQPADLKAALLPHLSTEMRHEAHESLFNRFEKRRMFHQALYHASQFAPPQLAIQTALENEHMLLNSGPAKGLSDLLGKIAADAETATQFDINQWAKFLLIVSDTAHKEDNLTLALEYGRKALTAPDLLIKVRAYYQRAKQLSRINLDECLSHYAVCFDLVERQLSGQTDEELARLITQMYIDRAWIFIQDRPDYGKASADLEQAETYIPATASELWCDFYNSRAGLEARTQNAQAALPFRLKAFTSAEASGDIERMTKVAYNVGLDYLYSDQYEQGLPYFEKSQAWAQQTGNLQTLGLAQKGIGGSYFFLGEVERAIENYLLAYETWKPTQNKSWLTSICFDLAEGYATVNDFENGRRFFNEGQTLAQQLEQDRFIGEFQALTEQFPALLLVVSDRQAEALAYVDEHGGINRQQYIDLTGVAKSQAYRDLEELCQEGFLMRTGKGRGTKYVRAKKVES